MSQHKGKFMKARIVASTSRPGNLSLRAWDESLGRYSARACGKLLTECFYEGQDVIIQPLYSEERKPNESD